MDINGGISRIACWLERKFKENCQTGALMCLPVVTRILAQRIIDR